jgi:CRP-like cAMP-binding protein
VDPGDIVYRQGDLADNVFCVISGWIQLHQEMADGRRHISHFLHAGDFFGAPPPGAHRVQSATAITTASICAIPTGKLNDLRRRHPAVNERLLQLLQNDCDQATQALTMAAQGNSIERVAHILWGIAVKLSKPGPVRAGDRFKAPFTQQHIADASGLTAIHVNRVMRRLREQSLVELRDGVMVIGDPGGLATLANEAFELDTASSPRTERFASATSMPMRKDRAARQTQAIGASL